MGHTQPDAGRHSDGPSAHSSRRRSHLAGLGRAIFGDADPERKDCSQSFGSGYVSESDPSGLRPSDPGAKCDAGKTNMWLMVSGFTPALALIELHLLSIGHPSMLEDGEGHVYPVPPVALATNALTRWPDALEEVAKVTNAGAKKYTPGGWKEVEDGANRYMGALLRHVAKLDEVVDDDTGCMHMAQVVWNALATVTLSKDSLGQIDTCLSAQQLAIYYLDALQGVLDHGDTEA